MGYEPRTFQSTTTNTPPTGTDPMVDNTTNGDVQAIKLINPTAGSTAPWIDQATRAQSLPIALSVEDAALLGTLLIEGAPETGQSLGAGGAHATGWLSSIRKAITDRLGTLGQKAMSASTPVVIASDQGAVAVSGTVAVSNFPATQPISGNVGVTGNVEVANDVGNPLPVSSATLATAAKQPALGTAGAASTDVITVQGIASGTVIPVTQTPATSGGLSIYRNLDAGTTGASVKASAGQLYGYFIYNNAVSTRYLKIYNNAGTPISSDTPVITVPIPAGAAANVGFASGIAFGTGIAIRASTGVADNDTGATTTNDVIVDIFYK